MQTLIYNGKQYHNYSVSFDGRIFTLGRSKKWLVFRVSNSGYYRVNLCHKGEHFMVAVHRVVCETFHGPCPSGYTVNHKDGDKLNNHINNLEWLTPSMNQHHAYRLGLNKNQKAVIGIRISDGLIKEWPSASKAARDIAKARHPKNIQLALSGKQAQAYGWYWSFA